VRNPNFNFIHKFANNEENESEFDHADTPYSQSIFDTSYIDILSYLDKQRNSTNISLLSLNIQSLPSKFNELTSLIISLSQNNCSPEIIALQEIWQVSDASHFPLPGYQPIIFKTRSTGQGGGGASISKMAFHIPSSKKNPSSLTNCMNPFSSKSHFHRVKKSPLPPSTAPTQNIHHSPSLNNSLNLTKFY